MTHMSESGERAKYCRDCQTEKPVSEFTRNARNKDGLAFYCRDCRILRDERSRYKRRGRPRIRVRPRELVVPEEHKWCPECGLVKSIDKFPGNRSELSGVMSYCKPCFNRKARESKEKVHGSTRNYHLRRRYGITVDDFDAMFGEQGGLCAICREAPAEHVDHDHASSRVRGLLCFNCNGALGQFRDRTDLMLRAIAYLGRDLATPIAELPDFHFGVHVGDFTDPRPPDEPRAA